MTTSVIAVNYNALTKVLEGESIANPHRTKSYLDILQTNIAKNAFEILEGETAIFEINHDDLHVTKLGEELQGKYIGIPDSRLPQSISEVFYDNVMNAVYQSQEAGYYDTIFKKIR